MTGKGIMPGKQSLSGRPKIRPDKEPIDFLLEIAGMIAVLTAVLLAAFWYSRLPQQIPTHFNAAGQPDGYSVRGMIWFLPILAVFLFTGMGILNHFPYIFNFPVNITQENAGRIYRHATRSMRMLNFLLVVLFLYLTWQTIAVASGKSAGLGSWFLPVTIGAILLVTIYMVIRMHQLK